MAPHLIQVFDFARRQQRLEGVVDVVAFPRLAEETADQAGAIKWSVQGGADRFKHSVLELAVSGEINLVCQRCLKPVVHDVSSEVTLVLARDEEEAERIEVIIADESRDVIVVEDQVDVMMLVEDDVLLNLPVSPRHAQCVAAGKVKDDDASPFSMLKKLGIGDLGKS